MLILQRREGEGLEVGDFHVMVTQVTGYDVRLETRLLDRDAGVVTSRVPMRGRMKLAENITLHVTPVDRGPNRVHIGIDAPRSVRVLRDELVRRGRPEPIRGYGVAP